MRWCFGANMSEASGIIQTSLEGHLFLAIEVQPSASRNAIIGINNWRGRLQLAVKAEPQKGAANKAVKQLLSDSFGLSKHSVTISQGQTARQKMVCIEGISAEELSEVIENHLANND